MLAAMNPPRKAPLWLALLAAVAMSAFAMQADAQSRETDAQSRETLGVGDMVRVTVFQNPDLTTEMRISERGTIVFPLIGEIALGGQTPADAGRLIAARMKDGGFMKNPQIGVAVVEVRSRQVSVLGNVVRPGRYVLDDAHLSLTDILALAGGISPDGADNVTVVTMRNGKAEKREANIPQMISSGDMSANFEIRNGDTIFVQRAPVFYVYGEVQRAGAYRLEDTMVVMHALSLGGGLTPRGSDRGITIHRRMPGGEVREMQAKLYEPVQAGDVIYVKERFF
ncbi:MAG TPA: polysaccharide export protein EpsE [Burkholderiales bacterium]|nr:polysaccharide export protein EpsE [Burkholderiales bacterium]